MSGVKFRELIRLLEDDGWQLVAQRDSHQQYEHRPNRASQRGWQAGRRRAEEYAANILRQAGRRRSR